MYRRYLDISLPRDTRSLYSISKSVNPRDTRPGDLVFFRIRTAKPSHVGIYLGRNRFIHASTSSGIIVSGLYEDYYRKHFMGYRRIPNSYLANNR
jgi:cell wall-associated NlpC family hydrolase